MKIGKPRIRIKRSTVPGTEPTFIASDELSNYTANTQITTGELYLNAADGMLWVGLTGGTSLIGAASAFTDSLSSYLPLAGNETITGPIDYQPNGVPANYDILVASGGTLAYTDFLDLNISGNSTTIGSLGGIFGTNNAIVAGGGANSISGSSTYSATLGGNNHLINGGQGNANIVGFNGYMDNSEYSIILGGANHIIDTANSSVILGGVGNKIDSGQNVAIIATQNVTGTTDNTTYMQHIEASGFANFASASASTLSAYTLYAHSISGLSPVQINGTWIENSSITATTFYSGSTDLSELIGGGGAVTSYTDGANNRIIVGTSATGIEGTADITYNGTLLNVNANISAQQVKAATILSGTTNIQDMFLSTGVTVGGSLTTQSVQSSNFSAAAGNYYPVVTTGGAVNVTPPGSPSPGDQFAVGDARGFFNTNNCNVRFFTAGQRFNGDTTSGANIALSRDHMYTKFEYIDATYGWTVVGGYFT